MKADYVHKDTLTATDYVELNKNNELLMSYNQSLKKQLEELEEENFNLRENIYIEKMSFSSEGRNIEELIEMPTYEDLLNQQKEFISYLEEKEKEFDILGDPKNAGACKGILRKYKEIIGNDINVGSKGVKDENCIKK